jgi:hypothetical protein
LIGDYVEIYGSIKKGLPLIFVGDAVIFARFASEKQLAEVLEKELAPR